MEAEAQSLDISKWHLLILGAWLQNYSIGRKTPPGIRDLIARFSTSDFEHQINLTWTVLKDSPGMFTTIKQFIQMMAPSLWNPSPILVHESTQTKWMIRWFTNDNETNEKIYDSDDDQNVVQNENMLRYGRIGVVLISWPPNVTEIHGNFKLFCPQTNDIYDHSTKSLRAARFLSNSRPNAKYSSIAHIDNRVAYLQSDLTFQCTIDITYLQNRNADILNISELYPKANQYQSIVELQQIDSFLSDNMTVKNLRDYDFEFKWEIPKIEFLTYITQDKVIKTYDHLETDTKWEIDWRPKRDAQFGTIAFRLCDKTSIKLLLGFCAVSCLELRQTRAQTVDFAKSGTNVNVAGLSYNRHIMFMLVQAYPVITLQVQLKILQIVKNEFNTSNDQSEED